MVVSNSHTVTSHLLKENISIIFRKLGVSEKVKREANADFTGITL